MKFEDIKKEKIVKDCEGCLKIILKDKTCGVYEKPSTWKFGCPMKTNKELEEVEIKKKINPIKKSKRGG